MMKGKMLGIMPLCRPMEAAGAMPHLAHRLPTQRYAQDMSSKHVFSVTLTIEK